MSDDAPPPPPDSPPTSGPPGSSGNTQRELDFKRIGIVIGILAFVVVIPLLLILSGGIPFTGCSANPTVGLVENTVEEENGDTRIAFQITEFENADYVKITHDESVVGNFTGIGNTSTVTGLSSGDELNIYAGTKCGDMSIENRSID